VNASNNKFFLIQIPECTLRINSVYKWTLLLNGLLTYLLTSHTNPRVHSAY